MAESRRVHIVALGCPKSRVDSERMAGVARGVGWELCGDPAAAEAIVVCSCGFLTEAAQESIDAVLELSRFRRDAGGRCRELVLAGCLSQRYPEELDQELGEVDHLIGTSDLDTLRRILAGEPVPRASVGAPGRLDEGAWERPAETVGHTAYLKVAEGCDRPCAFCVIPAIRGPQRSRSVASLVDEARGLLRAGARELCLVAQDTTAYGRDLPGRPTLAGLLRALDPLPGVLWLRVLYAYPTEITDDFIDALASLPRSARYLDVPVQHIDDRVLRRMKRGYSGQSVRAVLERVREAVPGVHLRTTLITGHPGETPGAHAELLRWLREAELDHVGVFPFSPEEGTDAAAQPDQVPAACAQERAAEAMEVQREVSRRKLRRWLGKTIEVLIDGESDQSEWLLRGRHRGQAPEVDGEVIVADGNARPGDLVRVKVTQTADHDLVGHQTGLIRQDHPRPR